MIILWKKDELCFEKGRNAFEKHLVKNKLRKLKIIVFGCMQIILKKVTFIRKANYYY